MWIYLIIAITYIAIGLAVHKLKWYFLISGYNTMSKEKQTNVDTEGLGRLMGLYSYANGGVFILAGILNALGLEYALVIAIIFTAISTIYLLKKAQKYDGNTYDKEGVAQMGKSKQTTRAIVFTVVTLIFVVGLMYFSMKPTKVTFLEEGLEIHGMYGDVYLWDEIEDATLLEKLPTITLRTNGSAISNHLKGHFNTKEMGSVKLHVNKQYPPFINLETNRKNIIFNLKDAEETQQIFDEILLKIK